MRKIFVPVSVVILLVTGSCSDILKVELPGRIPTDLLNDPLTAPTLAASVTADFECAFSEYVLATTTLSDQFLGASGNLNAKNWGTKKIYESDTGNETNQCGQAYGAYLPLQTVRFESNDVLSRLNGWTDAQANVALAPLRARVATFGAYAYTLLGEGFCAMRFDLGKQVLTPAQVLAQADAKFTAAIALVNAMSAGTDKTQLLNLVHAGRARERLDAGDLATATSEAQLVAPSFEFYVTRSVDAATRYNNAWYEIAELGNSSVDPAYRNLTVGGVPDPRVQVAPGPILSLPKKSFDGVTDLYVLTNKNDTRADPMRLASYVEAQLIIAEAQKGNTAVGIINARRTQLQLPQYTGPTDDASIMALVLDERNREFFMEGGQRYNDLLRFKISWKIGSDQNGIPYGTTTCMPLPLDERLAAGG
ncbi:MAG TPA: RagB/SusD family nutrient uptake outer membrane protein [Gemmatimonadaceae bacterium]|jgi:hypothetical protein